MSSRPSTGSASRTVTEAARRHTGEYSASLTVLAVDFGDEFVIAPAQCNAWAARRIAEVAALAARHAPGILCVTGVRRSSSRGPDLVKAVRAAHPPFADAFSEGHEDEGEMTMHVFVSRHLGVVDAARSGGVIEHRPTIVVVHVIVDVDEGEPARVAVAAAAFESGPRERVLNVYDLEHASDGMLRGVTGAVLAGDLRLSQGEDARLLLRAHGFAEAAAPAGGGLPDARPAVWMRSRADKRAGGDQREWQWESTEADPAAKWTLVRYVL